MTRNFNMAPGSTWRDVEGSDDAAEAAERHFEQQDARAHEQREAAARREAERAFNEGIREGIERRLK